MEQIDQRKAVENRLYSFMMAMNNWEVETKKIYGSVGIEKHGVEAGNQLKSIYDEYLTPKERKFGRLPIPHAGFPPEYDPKSEVIQDILIDGNKATIDTKWIHPVNQNFSVIYRYTMKLNNGKWLLDTKKKYSKGTDKWSNIAF